MTNELREALEAIGFFTEEVTPLEGDDGHPLTDEEGRPLVEHHRPMSPADAITQLSALAALRPGVTLTDLFGAVKVVSRGNVPVEIPGIWAYERYVDRLEAALASGDLEASGALLATNPIGLDTKLLQQALASLAITRFEQLTGASWDSEWTEEDLS